MKTSGIYRHYAKIVILEARTSILQEEYEENGTFFTRTTHTKNKFKSSGDNPTKRNCMYCERQHSSVDCTSVTDKTNEPKISETRSCVSTVLENIESVTVDRTTTAEIARRNITQVYVHMHGPLTSNRPRQLQQRLVTRIQAYYAILSHMLMLQFFLRQQSLQSTLKMQCFAPIPTYCLMKDHNVPLLQKTWLAEAFSRRKAQNP